MKFLTIISLVLFLLINPIINWAQTIDVRLVKVANQGINGGYFEAKLQIAATSGSASYRQGLANLKFFFNDLGLSNPTLEARHNFNSAPYDPLTFSVSGSRVSINVVPATGGSGNFTTINTAPTWTDVANIRFTIIDNTQSSGLDFTFANTLVYNDQSVELPVKNEGNLNEPLFISDEPTPLPVTLTSFTGKLVKNEGVVLNWSTATEINNEEFLVERSNNGTTFMVVGSVNGAGNSHEVNSYQLIDPLPLAGTTYYRLKQIDFDGTFEYSKIIPVSNSTTASFAINSVRPNPIQDQTNIRFTATPNSTVSLSITDLHGKTVWQKELAIQQEQNTFPLENLGHLSNGIYFVRLFNQDQSAIVKIVKE